jgi:hypothetical protein
VHDLRRTFATVHGELGTRPEILKALLNHTPQEITERVYNHALKLEPRRKAMQIWCEWLHRVTAGQELSNNQQSAKSRTLVRDKGATKGAHSARNNPR